MTLLHPALDAELAKDVVTIVGTLKINFPSGEVRLLDGSAEIPIDGQLYTGDDPVFGSWESVEGIEDGTGDDAPGVTITLLPATDADPAAIADPDMQGSSVRMSLGAVNEATGQIIGAPYLCFLGEIDVPVLKVGANSLAADYDCVGGMERLFFNDEGIRLAASWHRQVWPEEAGMDHVTGITETAYWGANPLNRGVTY